MGEPLPPNTTHHETPTLHLPTISTLGKCISVSKMYILVSKIVYFLAGKGCKGVETAFTEVSKQLMYPERE